MPMGNAGGVNLTATEQVQELFGEIILPEIYVGMGSKKVYGHIQIPQIHATPFVFQETDPIFLHSPAHRVTDQLISNWNSAYGLVGMVGQPGGLATLGDDGKVPSSELPIIASAFTNLTDVPHSYEEQGGKFVKVNSTEDGLEFSEVSFDLSGYAFLAGRAGGQVLVGGTRTGEGLTLVGNVIDGGFVNIWSKIKVGSDSNSPAEFYSTLIKDMSPAPELWANSDAEIWDEFPILNVWQSLGGNGGGVDYSRYPTRVNYQGGYAISFNGDGVNNFSGLIESFSGLTQNDHYLLKVSGFTAGKSIDCLFAQSIDNGGVFWAVRGDYVGTWVDTNPNQAINGDLESWQTTGGVLDVPNIPLGWEVVTFDDDGGANFEADDTRRYSGIFSGKFSSTLGMTAVKFIKQRIDFTLLDAQRGNIACFGYGDDNLNSFKVFILNDAEDKIYNWNSNYYDNYYGGIPDEFYMAEQSVGSGGNWNQMNRDYELPDDKIAKIYIGGAKNGEVFNVDFIKISASKDMDLSDFLMEFNLSDDNQTYSAPMDVVIPQDPFFLILGSQVVGAVCTKVELLNTITGEDVMINGSFTNWTGVPLKPTGWITGDWNGYYGGLDRESSIINTGLYSVKLSAGNSGGSDQKYAGGYFEGLTPGTSYDFKISLSARNVSPDYNQAAGIGIFDDIPTGNIQRHVDPNTGEWIDDISFNQWGNMKYFDVSNNSFTPEVITIIAPASGKLFIPIIRNGMWAELYVDTGSFKLHNAVVQPISIWNYTNDTPSTDMDEFDNVVKYRVGGVDYFTVAGDGSLKNQLGLSVRGTNTGDETISSIQTKLGASSEDHDGYLQSTWFSAFKGKQDAIGFTPENVGNKSNDSGLTNPDDTHYPSTLAIKGYVDNQTFWQPDALSSFITLYGASDVALDAVHLNTGTVMANSSKLRFKAYDTNLDDSTIHYQSWDIQGVAQSTHGNPWEYLGFRYIDDQGFNSEVIQFFRWGVQTWGRQVIDFYSQGDSQTGLFVETSGDHNGVGAATFLRNFGGNTTGNFAIQATLYSEDATTGGKSNAVLEGAIYGNAGDNGVYYKLIDAQTAEKHGGTSLMSIIDVGTGWDNIIRGDNITVKADGTIESDGAISGSNLSGSNTGDQNLDGKEDVGVAQGIMDAHTLAYDHSLIATALQEETDPVWASEKGDYYTKTEVDDFHFLTAETDPVFTASPAYGIASEEITDWNNAFGWGNHADAGYAMATDIHWALGETEDTHIPYLYNTDGTGETWITGKVSIGTLLGGANFNISDDTPTMAFVGTYGHGTLGVTDRIMSFRADVEAVVFGSASDHPMRMFAHNTDVLELYTDGLTYLNIGEADVGNVEYSSYGSIFRSSVWGTGFEVADIHDYEWINVPTSGVTTQSRLTLRHRKNDGSWNDVAYFEYDYSGNGNLVVDGAIECGNLTINGHNPFHTDDSQIGISTNDISNSEVFLVSNAYSDGIQYQRIFAKESALLGMTGVGALKHLSYQVSTSTVAGVISDLVEVFAVSPTGVISAQGYNSADNSPGVSGSFTTTDGKTITIKDGLVTTIV